MTLALAGGAWAEGDGDAPAIEDLRVPLVHVEVKGDGPIPMILIPDIGYDWTVFDSFMGMQEMSSRFTMHAVTLPGMVGTEAPPLVAGSDIVDLHTIRNAIAAIRDYIHEQDLATPVIVGHGFGGHLAAWIATRHPEDTRAAISINGMAFVPMGDDDDQLVGEQRRVLVEKRILAPHRDLDPDGWRNAYREQHFRWVTDVERALELHEMFASTDQEIVIQYMSEFLFSDLRESLTQNERPILFISAVHPNDVGAVINLQWKLALGDNPRNSTLIFIAECMHFAMEDDPWTLADAINDFIDNKTIENSRVGPGGAKVINPELDG